MSSKMPTLFMVTDIETTLKKRIAFDIAWKTIDRAGRVYDKGSYVIREAFQHDVPFFAKKLGHYFDDAFNHLITPASIFEVRDLYNASITGLQKKGHRVIPCAYNAAFDFKYMPETLQILADDSSLKWLDMSIELLDIWDYWGQSVPLHYTAAVTASKKFYSTSAESAFRFEFMQADFEERHMAWHDCEIEAMILLKALARKKALPVVKSPRDFAGGIYRVINNRIGVTGKEVIAA
jgi:hypothetical protein